MLTVVTVVRTLAEEALPALDSRTRVVVPSSEISLATCQRNYTTGVYAITRACTLPEFLQCL